MTTDIYDEAIASAKVLRERAQQVAEQRVLATVRPKIDKYLAQVMLEASEVPDDERDDDLLLGNDAEPPTSASNATRSTRPTKQTGQDVARDVEASIESGDDDNAGVSINDDGTYTLDLDSMLAPTGDAGKQTGSDLENVDQIDPAAEDELVLTGEAATTFTKLNALRELASAVADGPAAYARLVTAYDDAANVFVEHATATAGGESVVALTHLAEHVKGTYKTLAESNGGKKFTKVIRNLERIYTNVDGALVEAICTRLSMKLDILSGKVVRLAESSSRAECEHTARLFYSEVDGLCHVMEAVAGRIDRGESARMTAKAAEIVKEIKNMTRRLNEDEVVLKLDIPDDMAAAVRDAVGDGSGDDDVVDFDEEDFDEEEDSVAESRYRRKTMREADGDDDEDDADDEEIELDLGEEGTDDDAEELDFDDSDAESDNDVVNRLDALADVLRSAEGDVNLEIVDDDVGDEDAELDLDDLDLEDGDDDMDDSGGEDDDDQVLEIDMHELASAIGHMQSGKRRSRLAEGGRRSRPARPARAQSSTRNEVSKLRSTVAELKRKQDDSNLLSAKLLYTNKLLQRSDMSAGQRKRATVAMDEARNLGEVRLLYKNLTEAFDGRRPQQLGEGRRMSMGSSARSTVTSGVNHGGRTGPKPSDGGLMTETIDIDMWRRHAGLSDD